VSTYQVEVEIRPWPEGGFLAEAIGLQGCWVVSDSLDKVVDDIRDAVQLWIHTQQKLCWPLPDKVRPVDPAGAIRTVLPVGVP
jgi:predicted RNase H-like HicB family nuclease